MVTTAFVLTGGYDTLEHARTPVDIYLLPAGYPCAGGPPRSALTSLSLLLHRGLIAQVRAYAGTARLHVVPPLCPRSISPADVTPTSTLIGWAHRGTRDWSKTSPRRFQPVDDASVLGLHTHDPRPLHSGDSTTPQPAAKEGAPS